MPGNVEGVGKAPTVRAFEALVREESPDIVFLAEAKVKIARFERIKRNIDFVGFHCVEAVGKAGGLAVLWKHGVKLVASLVYLDPPDQVWMLLNIYGPHSQVGKEHF